jgi:hypothetical protein
LDPVLSDNGLVPNPVVLEVETVPPPLATLMLSGSEAHGRPSWFNACTTMALGSVAPDGPACPPPLKIERTGTSLREAVAVESEATDVALKITGVAVRALTVTVTGLMFCGINRYAHAFPLESVGSESVETGVTDPSLAVARNPLPGAQVKVTRQSLSIAPPLAVAFTFSGTLV